jgi:hypothetical protein
MRGIKILKAAILRIVFARHPMAQRESFFRDAINGLERHLIVRLGRCISPPVSNMGDTLPWGPPQA